MLYQNKGKSSFAIIAKILERDFCRHTNMGSGTELAEILYGLYPVEDLHLADDFQWFSWLEPFLTKTLIPHKIAVYQAGVELIEKGVVDHSVEEFRYNLWIHDLSKLSLEEWDGYARYNFKDPAQNSEQRKAELDRAWLHHKTHNPHHPEYWLSVKRDGAIEPVSMRPLAMLEMVADWIGAGRTYGQSMEDWLPNNLHTFHFHETTVVSLQMLLAKLGIHTTASQTNPYVVSVTPKNN